jgi:hypothetical protein
MTDLLPHLWYDDGAGKPSCEPIRASGTIPSLYGAGSPFH